MLTMPPDCAHLKFFHIILFLGLFLWDEAQGSRGIKDPGEEVGLSVPLPGFELEPGFRVDYAAIVKIEGEPSSITPPRRRHERER